MVSVAKVGGMALKFLLRTGSVSAVVQPVASWWWVLLWWCVFYWWVPIVVLAVLLSPAVHGLLLAVAVPVEVLAVMLALVPVVLAMAVRYRRAWSPSGVGCRAAGLPLPYLYLL